MENKDLALPESAAAAAPRRRGLLRTLKICLVLLAVLLAIALATPIVLSTGAVRAKVEREMAAALGAPVKIADHSVSLLSGITLEGVEIGNPTGFPAEPAALRLKQARGGVGVWGLLRGQVDVSAAVEGLEVRVFQRADGKTNFGEMFGVEVAKAPAEGEGEGEEPRPSEPRAEPPCGIDLSDVRLDCTLIDGLIEIVHERQGVLESLRDLTAAIRKEYGGSEVYLQVDAELVRPGGEPPGRLGVNVAADAELAKPLDARLDVSELDLARYRPLLEAFLAEGQLTAFAGVVGGNARALVDLANKSVRLSGNLDVAEPHFAGPWLRGLDIAERHWSFNPNVTVAMADGGGPPSIEAQGLRIDLGFLKVTGLAPEQANALGGGRPSLGASFAVDLGAVLKMGGPIPKGLAGGAGKIDGQIALAVTPESFDPKVLAARFAEMLGAEVKFNLDRVSYEGHEVTGLSGDLALRGGKAHASAGAAVGGGPVTLALDVDPTKAKEWPFDLKFAWKGGTARAPTVKLLRYAVPLFAGLDPSAAGGAVDLQSKVDCELSLRGPLLPTSFDSVLAWLDTWSGGGKLDLAEGAFTPAGALQPLLQLAGGSGRLDFRGLATEFTLANGFVETSLLRLSRKAGDIGLRGRTSLDGRIDYAIDLAQALARYKDGQKVLAALGGAIPEAKLTGTLDRPELAMPDIAAALQQATQGALQNAADQLLKKGIEGLIKKKG